MLQLEKINFKKPISQTLNWFTRRPAWCLVFLALLFLLWAAGLFWRYGLVKTLPPAAGREVKLKMELYQKILERLNAEETNIQKGIKESYPDVFR